MQRAKNIFLVSLAVLLSLCGCQKNEPTNESSSPSSSSEPQKERKTPNYLTSLPIPSDLKNETSIS